MELKSIKEPFVIESEEAFLIVTYLDNGTIETRHFWKHDAGAKFNSTVTRAASTPQTLEFLKSWTEDAVDSGPLSNFKLRLPMCVWSDSRISADNMWDVF